jgi:uncharacterized protein (TIGR00255 family)
MTGFGTASARAECAQVTIELSSVNRKQLDVVLRLPPPLAALESRVQKIIQEHISRGRISGAVQLDAANGGAMMQIDEKLAAETVDKLRRTAKKLNLKDDLSARMLLQLPGLLKMQAAEQQPEEILQLLEKALLVALKKLNTMRLREGKALETDLLARLRLLEQMLAAIKTRAPQIAANYRKKLFRGLETAGLKDVATDERIIKEIALFAERSDISEEITRLESHVQQFKKILRGGEPAGRPLDFLAQELFREINTIGSKANDLKITEQVVQFKTELERIREQIQNVE